MAMKFKNIFKPTPTKLKRLGNTLFGISTTITGYSLYLEIQWIAAAALGLGVLGKFITMLFSTDDES